jgi:hypothetical protein
MENRILLPVDSAAPPLLKLQNGAGSAGSAGSLRPTYAGWDAARAHAAQARMERERPADGWGGRVRLRQSNAAVICPFCSLVQTFHHKIVPGGTSSTSARDAWAEISVGVESMAHAGLLSHSGYSGLR